MFKAKKTRAFSTLFLLCIGPLFFHCLSCRKEGPAKEKGKAPISVNVKLSTLRAKPGEKVEAAVVVQGMRRLKAHELKATLFVPNRGAEAFTFQAEETPGEEQASYRGQIQLAPDSPQGLYTLTVEAERGTARAVGKGSFLVGRAVVDFLIVSAVSEENGEADIRRYFESLQRVGGNVVVIHNLITQKAWYPSRVCQERATAGTPEDKVGLALKLAEEFGLTSILSVSWDMTRPIPSSERFQSMISILDELWELYGSNPSLAGFYDYQEGSGTYLAAHLRDFSLAVKARNEGLLSVCAPYIDDPLLAGYLAAIEELDIVIYQGAVMASFRPDNRKCFPLRRTKDFTALSAGATLQKDKITFSHVELFGYLEKRVANAYLASPEDIRGQVLSAASAYGPDGIAFFTFHGCFHTVEDKVAEVARSRQALEEVMGAYRKIVETAASESSSIGLYIPYSDWWVDRWTNNFVPALDAFRRLGVSPDIIPFIPPPGEEVLPFYPYHKNEEQLEFLLSRGYVLVLTDIAGMQDTDSLLLKEFVMKGGVALLFGPRIPFGDSFQREEFFGGRENPASPHSRVEVRESLGRRTKKGDVFVFPPLEIPSWTPSDAKVLAAFEDGRAAFLRKDVGAGFVILTPLSLNQAVERMPDFVRDLFDAALKAKGKSRIFDVLGATENMYVAMTSTEKGKALAVVNYEPRDARLRIKPLDLEPESVYLVVDLKSSAKLEEKKGRELSEIRVTVPSGDYILLLLSKL